MHAALEDGLWSARPRRYDVMSVDRLQIYCLKKPRT